MEKKEEKHFLELIAREDFIKNLINQETVEDARKLFEEEGIKLTPEEVVIIGKVIEKKLSNKSVKEEDLEKILGGANGHGIYIGKKENSPWPKLVALVGGATIGTVLGGVSGNSIGKTDYQKGMGAGAGGALGMVTGAAVGVSALNAGRKFIKWLEK